MDEITNTLNERGKDYGSFDTMAVRTQSALRSFSIPDTMHPVYKEAIHMILQKMARAVNGRADVRDHWVDIAGYAMRVAEYIDKLEEFSLGGDRQNRQEPMNTHDKWRREQ